MASLYFFDNDRSDKNYNKVAGIAKFIFPHPVVACRYCFFLPLSSIQRFCNVYSQAAHFRSGFSGGEIHDLRRLRREGSPERLSRS